ncbi:MAG: hypothetical protein PUK67_03685 [Prevotellaceae bacterium]|nr:hypothetical protein [Prevotellaceae bacterium]MDY3365138.1 hypothetical protein [Prevotella sp.]
MKDIRLAYKDKIHTIPNRWDGITSGQYLNLVSDFLLMAAGKISVGEVRINHLCNVMGWTKRRFRTEEQIACLVAISEKLTFMFKINYPDNNMVLDGLSADVYERCQRIDPYRLDIPLARLLRRMEYRYVVDLCFCKQLVPEISVNGETYQGYSIDTGYGVLTCSLTALQYIEARELIERGDESLPLMAAILYYPGKEYNSEHAHALAPKFAELPPHVLTAVSFNFQAFNNYLFTCTSFSLLSKFQPRKASIITTDAADALYDLSKEGLGDSRQIEQMNILTYLKVLRKRTIDAVKELKGIGWDKVKISNEVGLPIHIIDDIL